LLTSAWLVTRTEKTIKNYPQNFGKAKVREFGYCKNFEKGIFCLFSTTCIHSGHFNILIELSAIF